jgi:hypothetical protein
MKVDAGMSMAGISAGEQKEVNKALESREIQHEIAKLSQDGVFSEEEQMKVGEMVADKASDALKAQGKEGLNNHEKMVVAEYCSKCFDDQANLAADQAANPAFNAAPIP